MRSVHAPALRSITGRMLQADIQSQERSPSVARYIIRIIPFLQENHIPANERVKRSSLVSITNMRRSERSLSTGLVGGVNGFLQTRPQAG